MLRLKTDEPEEQKVCYENFRSSVPGVLKQDKREFVDWFTGKQVTLNAFYPDPRTLDATEAVALLQELRWHLQRCLPKEKPSFVDLHMGSVWSARRRQTEVLIAAVKRRLNNLLGEVFSKNRPDDEEDSVADCPSLGLRTFEEHMLYWYARDGFAYDMDRETMEQIRLELEYQLTDWLDELDELSSENPDAAEEAPYQLRRFCCEERQLQMDQLDAMQKACRRDRDSDCEQLPITLDMEQAPQRLGTAELVQELEKVRLCMRSVSPWTEALPEKLRAKNTELLDELNRRMVSIICRSMGCSAQEQEAAEHAGPQGKIAYPVCFLEGNALEQPEDVICCWYLNAHFPYYMGLEQLYSVEKELKRQMDRLEMQEANLNDSEAGLWRLSWEMKEKQLDDIRELIYGAEAELIYRDEIDNLLEQI